MFLYFFCLVGVVGKDKNRCYLIIDNMSTSDDLEIKESCVNDKCQIKDIFEENKERNKDDDENNTFWGENPNILLKQSQLTELFPTEDMSFSRKLNAISRLLILISVITYFYTQQVSVLLICIALFGLIYGLWRYKNLDSIKRKIDTERIGDLEGFKNPADKIVADQLEANPKLSTQVFQSPTAANPLGNVLIPEIVDTPNRKPAPPSYNQKVNKDILDKTSAMIQGLNQDFPDITDRLFGSIGDQFAHEQSMRQFYTMPSTTVPNDQQAFSEFCYGGMISCKEGNQFACARNLQRYNNY